MMMPITRMKPRRSQFRLLREFHQAPTRPFDAVGGFIGDHGVAGQPRHNAMTARSRAAFCMRPASLRIRAIRFRAWRCRVCFASAIGRGLFRETLERAAAVVLASVVRPARARRSARA
jgi:hypothetical protein